jgi:hypothetical protein
MGLLDDAIREHLDLKRKHGARDTELKELEDDAFGGGEQPDPFASKAVAGADTAPPTSPGESAPVEEPTALVEPAAPPAPPEETEPPLEPPSPPEGLREEPDELAPFEPEHAPDPTPEAEPPSESLEDLMAEEEPPAAPPPSEPADLDAPLEPHETGEPSGAPLEPSAEIPVDEADLDADAGVPEPPPPPPEPGTEPPGRARGRVHVPTQEHRPEDMTEEPPGPEPAQPAEALEDEGKPELFDFETDEASFAESPPAEAPEDDFEALGPAEDSLDLEDEPFEAEEPGASAPAIEEDEPEAAPPQFEDTAVRDPEPADEPRTDERRVDEPGTDEPDILSESPEFTDEGTEGENLWFEKGPPKDFDFEDEDQDERR